MIHSRRGPRAKLGRSLPSERAVGVAFNSKLDLDGQMLALRPHRSDLVRQGYRHPSRSTVSRAGFAEVHQLPQGVVSVDVDQSFALVVLDA